MSVEPDERALKLGYLGLEQEDLGKFAEARVTFEQALAICEQTGEPADSRFVHVLNMNLGRVLEKLGHFEEAIDAYARAGDYGIDT